MLSLKSARRFVDIAPCSVHASIYSWTRRTDLKRPFEDQLSKDSTTAHAIRRRALAEARLKELELAKVEGSLIDAELVRRGLDNVAINFRTMGMSVPAQIGREIDEPEIRVRVVEIVDRRIREMLEMMARFDPVIEPKEKEDDDDQDDGPPDQPVGDVEARSEQRPLKKRMKKRKQRGPICK